MASNWENEVYGNGGQTSSQNKGSNITQNLSNILRGIGYGVVPDMLGGIQAAGQATGNAINSALGRGQASTQNDFMTPAQQQGFSNPQAALTNTAKDIGGAAATQATGELAGAALGKVLPFLTKSGVGAKIGQKVEKSVASGATDSWNDFTTEVRQAAAKKLGNDEPYASIINSRLSAETPASIETNPQINAQNLQDFRQQAANRIPKGIFQRFQGHSPSDQVDEIIRQVASNRLKDLAGTGVLDKIFSAYSRFGSPASIAGRAALGQAISSVVPEQNKGQVFSGVSGGLEALKILGVL